MSVNLTVRRQRWLTERAQRGRSQADLQSDEKVKQAGWEAGRGGKRRHDGSLGENNLTEKRDTLRQGSPRSNGGEAQGSGRS
jgi:hypothetical protein